MVDNPKMHIDEYLKLFDPSVHDAIRNSLDREGVTGAACLVNHVMDSSQLGHRTSLIYGLDCTFKSIQHIEEQKAGIYINGLPSSASFPEGHTEND